MMKTCTKCGQTLSLDRFHRRSKVKSGLKPNCKDCERVYALNQKIKSNNRCLDCNKLIDYRSKYCKPHSRKKERNNKWTGKHYIVINKPGHPNARKDGMMFEHVYVMSEYLSRPLLPNENVHHKNGVKYDNRIENLELWAKGQPAGQRVVDRVKWAYEIIEQYKEEIGLLMEVADD